MSGPFVAQSPTGAHGLHFTPAAASAKVRDHLYHGRPEINYRGMERPPPKKVIKLHTLGDAPPEEMSDHAVAEYVADYMAKENRKPTRMIYPGVGVSRFLGLTIPGLGYVGLNLEPREDADGVSLE
jgi:(2Fe-2S) ferredoxin